MENTKYQNITKVITEAKGIIEVHKAGKKQVNTVRHLIGLVLFIVIFIMIIPISLYKFKLFTILEGYLPNIDLIATCLSWHGGPYELWAELYPSAPVTIHGFLSQSFINYGALLGLTYIIARESAISRNAVKGWSLGIIMLLMTYLLPGNFITHMMNHLNDNIKQIARYPFIITLIGMLIAVSFILIEAFIIFYFKNNLESFGKLIIQFPKLF